MTIRAAYAVAEVFAAPEIVSFLFACVTGKAGLRNLFRRFVFERDDFCGIAFFEVGLTWPMASFAACYFLFPTADFGEARVGSVRERFELILVTVFASVAADVLIIGGQDSRAISRGDAPDHRDRRSAKNQ